MVVVVVLVVVVDDVVVDVVGGFVVGGDVEVVLRGLVVVVGAGGLEVVTTVAVDGIGRAASADAATAASPTGTAGSSLRLALHAAPASKLAARVPNARRAAIKTRYRRF